MDYFQYCDNRLYAENVDLGEVAKAVGTPFYCYSAKTLTRHYKLFTQSLEPMPHLVCFAVKSLSNVAVLKLLGQHGAGMDVVSGGEYLRAKAAGICGDKIVFSGVGKTKEEMILVLQGGIRQINVESEPELELLSQVAVSLGVLAPIALRINPDVDAKTHEKIATGKSENKFGIPIRHALAAYDKAARLPSLKIVGIDMHIGSQLTELAPFEAAFIKLRDLVIELRQRGHEISRVDLGGGLGIPYTHSNQPPPLPADYAALIKRVFTGLGCEIEIEPGRLISGNAGILVSSVIYTKQGEGRDFIILDAAMNDLARPAMYGAHHDVIPLKSSPPETPKKNYDIVGPVCETGDTFIKDYMLPPLRSGDMVAFRTAGAYCAVMANEYNTRRLIPEVLVSDKRFAIIRERPSYEEIITRDKTPSWL